MSPRPAEALHKAADFGEGRLADMDSAGVRMQVISLNSPALQGMSGDTAKAVDVAKEIQRLSRQDDQQTPEPHGGICCAAHEDRKPPPTNWNAR